MAKKAFHTTTTGLMVIYLAGLVLFLAGFGSTKWVDKAYSHNGLWKSCTRSVDLDTWSCGRPGITNYEPWMAAVCGMMIVALAFAGFAGFIYVFVPISATFQIIAALFTGLSVMTFAVFQTSDNRIDVGDLGWSFWVTCLGGCVFLISGLALAGMACSQSCHMKAMLPPPEKEIY